jgi:hypothetical protein
MIDKGEQNLTLKRRPQQGPFGANVPPRPPYLAVPASTPGDQSHDDPEGSNEPLMPSAHRMQEQHR